MKQTETASARRLLHCIKLEDLVDRNPLPTFPNLAGSDGATLLGAALGLSVLQTLLLTADRVIE